MSEESYRYKRRISNPHLKTEQAGEVLVFDDDTLLFYGKKVTLGKLDSKTSKMKGINKGSKIHDIERTIYNPSTEVYLSRTKKGLWIEWEDDIAHLEAAT